MTQLDPRFDPRYQRGYDPARHPVTDVDERMPPADAPRDAEAALAELGFAGEPTSGVSAAGAGAARASASGSVAPMPAPHVSEAGARADGGADHGEALADPPQTDEGPLDRLQRIDPWYAAGWLLTGVLLLVAAWLVNRSIEVQMMFVQPGGTGVVDEETQIFQALGWVVTGPTVSAAAFSLVAMLFWTSLRQLRGRVR